MTGAGVAALALTLLASAPAAADTHESKGRRVFEAKQCGRCHVTGGRIAGGPPLEHLRRPQGAWELTGKLWNHVPAMFTAITAAGVPWPQFSLDETTDLMGYLGATAGADPKPDPNRGLSVLVQKGCLKCHALRGEGGGIAPDFAGRAAAFASPATWAQRIWTHTPGMAKLAAERGVLYPRFTGQEMTHLVAYLSSVGTARPAR